MMRSVIASTAVALGALSALASAQPRTAFPEKRGFQKADFPRVVKIAKNVFGYEDFHTAGMMTVSMFVVGRDGVLLVDGQGSPAATQRLVDVIAKTAGIRDQRPETRDRRSTIPDPRPLIPPIKWYVVGSDHGDHTAGNAVLPQGITYIVHPTSRAQLERDAANTRGRVVVVPPTAMSGDKQVVDLGGMEAHVLFLGRAHTGGDLMVYLPKQKILFMSEAYLNRVFPAMRSAYPSEWVKTLDRALALDVDIFVPGHGFIETAKASREELVEFQKALRHVIGEVQRLHKMGLSVEEARTQANWGPYKEWMLSDQQDIIAIRKVYEEIEGKLK